MKTICRSLILICFFSLLFCLKISAQTQQDCCGALSLDPALMNTPMPMEIPLALVTGNGAVNESFLPCASCNLSEIESNSIWFAFESITGGTFELLIEPLTPPQNLIDFNFTLFQEQCPCNSQTVEVACDANPATPANQNGGMITGISSDPSSTFGFLPYFPPFTGSFQPTVTLQESTTYYLNINAVSSVSAFAIYIAGTGVIAQKKTFTGPFIEPPLLMGDFDLCPGATGIYYMLKQGEYTWTITPPVPYDGMGGTSAIFIDWEDPGVYEICVAELDGCEIISETACETVIINEIPPTLIQEGVCLGDPYIADNGLAYFAPGVFDINY